MQRRRHDVVGGIKHVHAAILELGQQFRLEHHVPAVDRGIGAEALMHCLDVVADAGGPPHVIDGVLIAGIVDGEPLGDLGPDINEVRQLALVELLKYAGLDLAFEEIGGRHDDVVTGLAGEQLGFQRLIGVKGVILHLDAGRLAEILQHLRVDIVRPVVDIDHALLRGGRRRDQTERGEQNGGASMQAHGLSLLHHDAAVERERAGGVEVHHRQFARR